MSSPSQITSLEIIEMLPKISVGRLNADPYFCDITVVAVEEGKVSSVVNEKQGVLTSKNGKYGACVIVPQIIAEDDFPEDTFGPLKLFPAFIVYEQVELNNAMNGTKKSARKIARQIHKVMKCFSFPGLCTTFVAQKRCIVPVPLSAEAIANNLIAYQVTFYCYEHDEDKQPVQVSAPTFGEAGQTATIATITPGAEIWYVTDDSYPSPQNPNAQVYSAPILIPVEGITLSAVAYCEGMIASEVARSEIT